MKTQGLILLTILFSLALLSGASLADSYEWSAQIKVTPKSITSSDFDVIKPEFKVLLKNTGNKTWNQKDERLYLSYHIYDKNGAEVSYDNPRHEVPNLNSLQQVSLNVPLPAGLAFGPDTRTFRIDFDLVREGVNWFSRANLSNHFPKLSLVVRKKSLEDLREEPAVKMAKNLALFRFEWKSA